MVWHRMHRKYHLKKIQNLKLYRNRFTQFVELIEWYLYVFQVILLLRSDIKKESSLAFKMNAFALLLSQTGVSKE
ncbi:hypothetical protein LguiB_031493 [Lonicera macranthoides]